MQPRHTHGSPLGVDSRAEKYAESAHWEIIWPRTIALAWASEEFKHRLLEDAATAIREQFGYPLSGHIKMTVKEVDGQTAEQILGRNVDYRQPDRELGDPWEGMPPLELTLYLPPAPEERDQAVALAAYQDSGRTYPFTCC